jgi:hypothetical protein
MHTLLRTSVFLRQDRGHLSIQDSIARRKCSQACAGHRRSYFVSSCSPVSAGTGGGRDHLVPLTWVALFLVRGDTVLAA